MAEVTAPATVTASSSAQAQPPKAEAQVEKPQAAQVADPLAKAPSPEVKPDATKPAAEAPKADTPLEPVYDLKLAGDSLLNAEVDVKEVVEFAKANKIAPEVASKILEQRDQAVKQYSARQQEMVKKVVEGWKGELPNDPEIGGNNLPAALEDSKRFLEKFGTPELIEALNQTGYGNHKLLIKAFARAGKALRDDSFVSGKATVSKRSVEDILFPMSELNAVNPAASMNP